METIKWFYKTKIGNMALAAIWCVLFGTLAENIHIDFIIPMYVGVLYFMIVFGIMVYYQIVNLIEMVKKKLNK